MRPPLNEITGTPGDDVIHGTAGPDGVDALGGDDRVFTGPGRDVVLGRGGDDLVNGGGARDILEGGRGDDVLFGGAGDDDLDGGGLFDGGPATGSDEIHGGSGNDTVRAGDGHDLVTLGSGDDLLFADAFGDATGNSAASVGRTEVTDFRHGEDALVVSFDVAGTLHYGPELDTDGDGRIGAGDADVRVAHGALVLDLGHAVGRLGDHLAGQHLLVLDHVDHLTPTGVGIEIG